MRIRLRRRGVDHGLVTPLPRGPSRREGEPEVIRRAVAPPPAPRALRILGRLRNGEDLSHVLRPPRGFRYTGLSRNTADPLELHKAHVAAQGVSRELYVKVNWLSSWPGDASVRLRFSFGTEILDDWIDDPAAGRAVLRLCEGSFPECRRVTRNRRLAGALRRRLGSAPRFLQPIVYSNAPGGGALFHHDRVPGQEAVLFAQLAGRTAWLALPRRELDLRLRRRGLRLGDPPSGRAERLLNRTPSFTRELAAEGWLSVLSPGDAILLPGGPAPKAAWHSVFALGRGPSLAVSLGIALNARGGRAR